METPETLTTEEIRALTPDRQWEFGIDHPDAQSRASAYLTYTRDAVLRYRARDIQELIDKPGTLLTMIRHHKNYQVPRLDMLEAYYLGNNPNIMTGSRRLTKGKSDHRVRHGWASIISDFLNSYVLSSPVKVEGFDDKFGEILTDFDQANDVNAHNIEMGKDQNNFGRAYELLQRTSEDQDRIYQLDPRTVFMIYDQTVRTRVIGACRYFVVNEFDSSESSYFIELYTHDKIYRSGQVLIDTASTFAWSDTPEEHAFGGVPIVEYRSDRYRMGVFEKQIPQIDAYDAAQSDTANYMTDFNDAILAIRGRIQNADDEKYIKGMTDANLLFLIPATDGLEGSGGPVEAGYLTKSYDVAGVEAYKSRLKSDLFNSASTPDLSDSAFAGQQSGEALKYKMFGLQQRRNDKEKFFGKGLRIRYKLLENLKRAVSEYTGEDNALTFKFTPNLPKAYLEELKAFKDAGGDISNDTMLSILSFIEDSEEETEKIKAERQPVKEGFEQTYRFGDDHGTS